MTGSDPRRTVTDLMKRLEEAEDTIRAIRNGEVDAFVMQGAEQERVFAVESADGPYRLLVERMQQGAATLSSDGAVLYCNQRFSELLNTSPEDLFGKGFDSFVQPADRLLWEALRCRGEEHGSSQGEITLETPEGVLVPVYTTLGSFGKEIAGLSLMLTDLTQHKKLETVLASEALSLSILEQAADAILVCDAEGKIVRASRAAQALCEGNPMLQPFDDHFALVIEGAPARGKTASRDRFSVDPILRGETIRGLEVCLLRESGQLSLLLGGAPLNTGAGTVGCVVTLTDISDRKKVEQALRDGDRRKDEFLAVLGHELRNALGPIRNAAQLQKLAGGDEETMSHARSMTERQVGHMTRLIDDLSDVTRIARGKILLHPEPIELCELVRSIVEDYRPVLETTGLAVTVETPAQPMETVGDKTRLTQVVGNVLQNAAKFTDRGGRVLVRVALEAEGSASITVRDSGIGMDADALARVFDYFSQSDRSVDRSRGGLGLGMALARGLVELHGGEMAAASEGPGRGSEFVIRLPLVDQPELELERPPEETRSKLKRILIIEDNVDMAESLRMLFDLSGYPVTCACTGQEGVDLAREFRPDVVLCDIGLPGGMDGYAVAAALRLSPRTQSAVLIALSGYAQDEDRRRALASGFDLYVRKPVEFEELERVLASLPGQAEERGA